MSQLAELWGLDDWIDKCGYCGQHGCMGTCRVTENTLDDEEVEPLDGDSYDDAMWDQMVEEGDDEDV